jgi:hypothetical protein
MAKKSRRTRRAKTVKPVHVPRPVRPLASEQTAKEVDFAKEYHYVVEDLKRIAVIALALLILLVALALILG